MSVRDKAAVLLTLGLSVALGYGGIVPAAQVQVVPACAPVADAGQLGAPLRTLPVGAACSDPRLAELNWLLSAVRDGQRATPIGSVGGEAGEQVRELPPPPSSLALVLSGLASFGAYHGLRSLKRLHLGHLPDWYHADAAQLGHVTPLSIEFDWSALPACVFDTPSDLRPYVVNRIPREDRAQHQEHFFLQTCSPRSPPASA